MSAVDPTSINLPHPHEDLDGATVEFEVEFAGGARVRKSGKFIVGENALSVLIDGEPPVGATQVVINQLQADGVIPHPDKSVARWTFAEAVRILLEK